ncbi:adenosylcobalamin-dependent ribonucleoside-diphosphate reductase, partial [bacterium]|nr:adenosylcobalamin-dependent ribonucleoside-diphosphate reductase [bacterium]
DPKSSQREIGVIKSINGDETTVALRDESTITIPTAHIDKPIETTVEEMMDRVARGASAVEAEDVRSKYEKEFRWLLDSWKFVPGGRILTACGTEQNLTYYNCYVVPSPQDSRDGIIATLSHMAEIMSRGGGVGINLSTLRPRHAYVKGVNGRSSGSVSWGGLYSFVTGLIEQGGSRRGALMLILNVWHPDILEFIDSKRTAGKIVNANISVNISADFMKAVESDADWELVFPDTNDPNYNAENWTGDLKAWKDMGGKVTVHKVIKAREIWDKIIKSAWASAEPGIWFGDRCTSESNSWYYPQGRLVCTNPCGEQPLPAWGVCNLGHINLSKMYRGGDIDWETLGRTVRLAVRFLDNIIDTTPYFFEQNRSQQHLERRVGLGSIGLAELLIRAGVRYGSPACEEFIDRLYSFIAVNAYEASAELAQEKGCFPNFDADKLLQSDFMKRMPESLRAKIKASGLRNVTLLTQAPTGTVGTMVGTSTGIEPFYFWSYTRKSRLGTHTERVKVLEEYEKAHPNEPLPNYFVSAMELTPEEHVRTQAAIQRWVDSAISKTCNVPSTYTVEQTRELYELMYRLGCKGGTIYRDKSRDEQVLSVEAPAAPAPAPAPAKPDTDKPKVRPRLSKRHGVTVTKETPAGTCHIIMNDDDEGHPFEMFIEIGKGGSDIKAMAEALGRMASILLRIKSPVTPEERIQEIVKQLRGIGGQRSMGFGKARVKSLPDALAQALQENYMDSWQAESEEAELLRPEKYASGNPSSDICPQCGNASFVNVEGCTKCYNCGHSEC